VAPVEEPRLQELLTKHKAHICATRDWSKAVGETDVTAIIVPTPSGADGAFRNDYVLSVMDEVGHVLASKPGYHLVVVHATTMPGAIGGPIRERLERVSGRTVGAISDFATTRNSSRWAMSSTACCIPTSSSSARATRRPEIFSKPSTAGSSARTRTSRA
jgi:UDP-N-acetyl-D-mannosaminuronate dehydrogenase